MGFYVGFDGNCMYDGPPDDEPLQLKTLVAYAPTDRIVIESDSPYLTPYPYRGKRNEPKYVILTAQFIAEIKNISLETLIEQTDKNVYTLFTKLKK
jgi:TatD DNase family protein